MVALTSTGSPAGAAPPPRRGPAWHPGIPPIATPWTRRSAPTNALPEYPRPQLTRNRWQNLNGVWEFAGADAGQPVAGRAEPRRAGPRAVPDRVRAVRHPAARGPDVVPPHLHRPGRLASAGQRLLLHFGAVDYDAKVCVNGTQVGTHRGGYDGFTVDVTDALVGTGPQELIVWAEDLTDATGQPIGKQRRASRPRHLLPRQLRHLADGVDGAGPGRAHHRPRR